MSLCIKLSLCNKITVDVHHFLCYKTGYFLLAARSVIEKQLRILCILLLEDIDYGVRLKV
jgi:hypothetical protein